MANSDLFSTTIAAALGIDPSQVSTKLSGLTISQMIDLTNAMSDGNSTEMKAVLDQASTQTNLNPVLADPAAPATNPTPAPNGQAAPASTDTQATAPANALAPTDDNDDGDEDEEQTNESADSADAPSDHMFRIGDKVMVGDDEGVVKLAKGPNDTVGCLVNGVSRMVKRKNLRPVVESVLGAADLQTLVRMQVLAGIEPTAAKMPFQIAKIRTNDVPLAPPTQAKAIATATNFGNDDCAELSAYKEIEDAFARIADALPDIKQAEVKNVRQMVNDVCSTINEDAPRFSFFKSLTESRKASVPHDQIVNRVRKIGYTLREADEMVANYLDVLGRNTNDEYANLLVKQAIASLLKSRDH